MPYTLWHCGVLIGETDFEEPGRRPPQYAGIFRPTDYGLVVFPRLTGILTAEVLAFKQIAFIDLAELAVLSRKLGCREDMDAEALPPEAPQYVVSVTLGRRDGEDELVSSPDAPLPRLGPRHS
jgi:hypothetical protein